MKNRRYVPCPAGSQDRTIRVWSLESFSTIKTLMGHVGGVNAAARSEIMGGLCHGNQWFSAKM